VSEPSRLFDGVATEAEHHADLRAREEDLTPRGVARAVLAALCRHDTERSGSSLLPSPYSGGSILDVCAGYGVWSSEVRRLWPGTRITAVELDERKQPHLEKWADEVLAGSDWTLALDPRTQASDAYYDLAVGNPHFSALTHEDPSESMPVMLLDHAPAVLLFHQEQSFQKSEAGARVWHTYPPAAVFSVPGSVRFRRGINPKTGKPYGADARCYQATLWVRGHRGPAALSMLPWLPAAARRWTVQPGTEDPGPDLPAAPTWRP